MPSPPSAARRTRLCTLPDHRRCFCLFPLASLFRVPLSLFPYAASFVRPSVRPSHFVHSLRSSFSRSLVLFRSLLIFFSSLFFCLLFFLSLRSRSPLLLSHTKIGTCILHADFALRHFSRTRCVRCKRDAKKGKQTKYSPSMQAAAAGVGRSGPKRQQGTRLTTGAVRRREEGHQMTPLSW